MFLNLGLLASPILNEEANTDGHPKTDSIRAKVTGLTAVMDSAARHNWSMKLAETFKQKNKNAILSQDLRGQR